MPPRKAKVNNAINTIEPVINNTETIEKTTQVTEPVTTGSIVAPVEKEKKKRVSKKTQEKNKIAEEVAEIIKEHDTLNPVVVVQLAIPQNRINDILQSNIQIEDKRPIILPLDNSSVIYPLPYDIDNKFESNPDKVESAKSLADNTVCFWCCYKLTSSGIGLPIRHDVVHNTFTQFGTFCSLECASAYNFSNNQGSERVWEINSWIHLLARNLGLNTPIRPAPSKYMLQLFGGPMSIEEFRKAHIGMTRTFVQNIPPLITVNPQMEVVNTSFLSHTTTLDLDKIQQATEKVRISRKKSVVDYKNTLDSKINLSYVEVS